MALAGCAGRAEHWQDGTDIPAAGRKPVGFAAGRRALAGRDKRSRRGSERALREAPVVLGLGGLVLAVLAHRSVQPLEVGVRPCIPATGSLEPISGPTPILEIIDPAK